MPTSSNFLLITSAFHLRRAKGCFEKVGLKVDTFSTDFYSAQERLKISAIVPSPDAFTKAHKLIHETVGYVVYKIMGYI